MPGSSWHRGPEDWLSRDAKRGIVRHWTTTFIVFSPFGLEKSGPKEENKAVERKRKVNTLLCCSYQKGSIVVRSEFDASKKLACLSCRNDLDAY